MGGGGFWGVGFRVVRRGDLVGWCGGMREGESVVPAAPALRPSAERSPLLAQRRARNGAPGNGAS